VKNHRANPEQNGYWTPQNIIIGGELKIKNLIALGVCTCLYIGIASFIILTIHFSHLANVNVGIVTTIWGVQPLIAGILDYFINGEKLTKYHISGIAFIVAGGVLVSISGQSKNIVLQFEDIKIDIGKLIDGQLVPKYVAVFFGAITPIFFVTASLFTKHVTKPSVGFNAQTIWASGSLLGSLIIFFVVVVFFSDKLHWNAKIYSVGFFSAIFDTLGKYCQ